MRYKLIYNKKEDEMNKINELEREYRRLDEENKKIMQHHLIWELHENFQKMAVINRELDLVTRKVNKTLDIKKEGL